MEIKKICELIDARRDELFALLSEMIRIPSENHGSWGEEAAMAEHLRKMCLSLGLECEMYAPTDLEGFTGHPDYIPGRALENRYNVSARWRGEEDGDALMIMAHSDTVEVGDRANWMGDPFSGEIRDGKVFGRGACDDKYALAAALFLIRLLKEEGFAPKKDLVFAAYSDEENGGSHGALAAVLHDPCPHILNMDGKVGQIWHCGTGGGRFRYCYHTASPVDSAEVTARAIPIVMDELEVFRAAREAELNANPYYAGTIIPSTALRYMGMRAGNEGADLGVGFVHFVYYTDKTRPVIEAELAEVEKKIAAKLAPLGIVSDGFVPTTRFFHYVHCAPDSEDILTLCEAAREAGEAVPLVCGSCLSDLSVISKYGNASAFGFGAGRNFNEEGGAHQPNEFIECDVLVSYTKTLASYILKMIG